MDFRSPGIGEFWRRLREAPDALMLDLGAGGELLVAKLRVALSLALLLLPLANLVTGEFTPREGLAGLLGVTAAVVFSQLWLLLARPRRRFRWLPWVTSSYDVSLTTLVLAVLAWDTPATGINSMVVWAFYLVAVMMTALRNDGRVTLYTGALAMLQYGLLAALVFALVQSPEHLVSAEYGTARASNVVQRLVLIGVGTAITATIVFRMQRLVQMSGSDGLTGLPNRTLLVHHFPVLAAEARGRGTSLSLALIDLDHFRRVNDQAGHGAGDAALRAVVDRLRARLQPRDWLVRLSGEEFVLLMELPIGRAFERVEELRQLVAADTFAVRPDLALPLTFSAGLATWPVDGGDLSQLLRCADLRLRRAKLQGRNMVVARDA